MTTDYRALIILICILCVVIGVLLCMNYSYKKDLYNLSNKIHKVNMFTDMLLNNIATQEGIDIKKYLDMTSQELEDSLKGGE